MMIDEQIYYVLAFRFIPIFLWLHIHRVVFRESKIVGMCIVMNIYDVWLKGFQFYG